MPSNHFDFEKKLLHCRRGGKPFSYNLPCSVVTHTRIVPPCLENPESAPDKIIAAQFKKNDKTYKPRNVLLFYSLHLLYLQLQCLHFLTLWFWYCVSFVGNIALQI